MNAPLTALAQSLEPNLEEARRFLQILDPFAKEFAFQAFMDRKGPGYPTLARVLHGTLDEHAPELVRRNRQGAGIFVTVNMTDGKGRKAANIIEPRAIWQEDDAGFSGTFPLPPSIVVESSPGKHHRYWLIETLIEALTADEHRGVMEHMVEFYGSDPSAKDLSRVLRVPGFFHMKGEPFQVRIVEASGTRYTRDEILKAFPPSRINGRSVKPDSLSAEQAHTISEICDPLCDQFAIAALRDEAKRLAETPPGGGQHGGRNHALNVAAFKLGRFAPHRLSAVEIEATLFDACVQNGLVDDGEAPVQATLASGLKYGMANPRWDGIPTTPEQDFADVQLLAHGFEQGQKTLEFPSDISIEEILRKEEGALVKGLLHPGETAMLYGQSGAGKSFVALDLAWHVATGREWHGNRVKQAAALYVCLEGVDGFRKRMKAYEQVQGDAGKHIARLALHVSLVKSGAGKKGAVDVVQAAAKLSEESGCQTGLIVIDTLARAMAGDDENATADMMHFVEQRAGHIARSAGAAVIVVHHTNAAGSVRGNTSLFAGCDLVLRADRDGERRTLFAEKVKDGAERALFHYSLDDVQLGLEEDGSSISSCVVRTTPANLLETKKSRLKQRRVAKPIRVFREAFHSIECNAAEVGLAETRFDLARVRAEFESLYSTGEGDPDTARQTKARKWRSALESVADEFEFRDEQVWRQNEPISIQGGDPFGS